MKYLFIFAFQLISLSPLFAQVKEGEIVVDDEQKLSLFKRLDNNGIFNNLEVSVTTGSTGVGIELATPVTEFARLRTGFDAMPRFETVVNFGVRVGKKQPGQTDKEYAEASKSKFQKLSGLLASFTGQEVDDNVDIIGRPSFHNFKLLVDVFPFAKSSGSARNLYVTAGFYWGNSNVVEAFNTTEDMPTLFSVRMYNSLYERVMEDNYFQYNPIYGDFFLDPIVVNTLAEKIGGYGRMGIHKGDYTHDGVQKYYDKDVQMVDELGIPMYDDDDNPIYAHRKGEPMFDENGNPVLTYRKGDPYMMEPDEDCMVKAKIRANSFKPYLGFGYGTDMAKSKSGWGLAVDVGALFWGGSPSVITHDGTDLVHDVENVSGKVGRYVRAIKKFKVYPVINIRLTKRLFK